MFVFINFDVKDEKRMRDILQPVSRDYTLYIDGTLELCAAMFEMNCCECKKIIEIDENDEIQEKMVIFSCKSKGESMEILCELTSTGLTKVQTAVNIPSFFELRKVSCRQCQNKETVDVNTSVVLSPKVAKIAKVEVSTDNESDAEEEFRTFNDSMEVDEPPMQAAVEEKPLSVPSLPHAVPQWKPETRAGRSFVENQERYREPKIVKKEAKEVDNEVDKENNSTNKALKPVIPKPSRPIELNTNVSTVEKGEETCNECSKVLKVALGADFNTNMTYSINSHSRTHVGKNPFGCEICDYKCRFANLMKKHFKNHHPMQKLAYSDISNDSHYLEEVYAKAKQCFPDWVPVYSRNSIGGAIKKVQEE